MHFIDVIESARLLNNGVDRNYVCVGDNQRERVCTEKERKRVSEYIYIEQFIILLICCSTSPKHIYGRQ